MHEELLQSAPPAPETPSRRSSDERKELLAHTIAGQIAQGSRVESQSDYQAVLVEGHRVNHVLHLILTFFTMGMWGVAWLILALTGGEQRSMATVDEFANVAVQKL